ncbi:uncharacterized protein BJ171DRAFT_598438 [Polychytrium aggregatum]|uniref:uncharacterized protein n=1 Tax=Polychytrium aggregatum TaxID=110093 RepID=UPI0022FE0C32|nr:uncharacterized protein BJ171DRAFT_598438 [Polychytrium aggregatum]KAI9205321.1 hypothetical protein BJ171DRAFT_598438 [Polychytrium aggregatum]
MRFGSASSNKEQARLGTFQISHYPGDPSVKVMSDQLLRGHPPYSVNRRNGLDEPVIVTAIDLKKLTQQIAGYGMEEKLRQMKADDRQERYRLSKERVANWENTIAGQRRKKLQFRQEKYEAEEAERQILDKQYKQDEAERRREAINRAKKLQYYETDLVKAFHSKVLLHQVLQERDKQLALKKERQEIQKAEDGKYLRAAEAKLAADIEAEAKVNNENRKRDIATAHDQMQQHRLKLDKEEAEIQRNVELGKAELKADQEYKMWQQAREIQRRAEGKALQKELLEMARDTKVRAQSAKSRDLEEEKRIHAWTVRKAQQVAQRKRVEKKWIEDGIQMREKLGERQFKICKDEDIKLEERIAKAAKEKEVHDITEILAQEDKKKRQQEELKLYFKESIRQAEEAQKVRKQLEKQELDEYMRIHKEVVEEDIRRRARNLETGKKLQEFHIHQMEQAQATRQCERQRSIDFDKTKTDQLRNEEQDLQNYMRDMMTTEKWAQENPRLKAYIHNQLSPHATKKDLGRHSSARRQRVNTAMRLGLVGRYGKVDTARANPICAGDFLKVVGEPLDLPGKLTPALVAAAKAPEIA